MTAARDTNFSLADEMYLMQYEEQLKDKELEVSYMVEGGESDSISVVRESGDSQLNNGGSNDSITSTTNALERVSKVNDLVSSLNQVVGADQNQCHGKRTNNCSCDVCMQNKN